MDWSKILIITMLVFIGFIVTLGINMANSTSDLYEEDYYQQGEKHETRLALEKVGQNVEVIYQAQAEVLKFNFDSIGSCSHLDFKNIADKKHDVSIDLSNKNHKESQISVEELSEGLWIVEIEGKVNGEDFFKKYEFVK
ncbi:hypothetical protein GYB22_11280 [bacterium]|nr:hypothetical protein [bacterium]